MRILLTAVAFALLAIACGDDLELPATPDVMVDSTEVVEFCECTATALDGANARAGIFEFECFDQFCEPCMNWCPVEAADDTRGYVHSTEQPAYWNCNLVESGQRAWLHYGECQRAQPEPTFCACHITEEDGSVRRITCSTDLCGECYCQSPWASVGQGEPDEAVSWVCYDGAPAVQVAEPQHCTE